MHGKGSGGGNNRNQAKGSVKTKPSNERGTTYDRKVDFPQSGSPSRRMVTVGGSWSSMKFLLYGVQHGRGVWKAWIT